MHMAVLAKDAVDQEFRQAIDEHKEIEEQLKDNLRTADELEKAIEKMRKPHREKGEMRREEKKQRSSERRRHDVTVKVNDVNTAGRDQKPEPQRRCQATQEDAGDCTKRFHDAGYSMDAFRTEVTRIAEDDGSEEVDARGRSRQERLRAILQNPMLNAMANFSTTGQEEQKERRKERSGEQCG